MTKYRVMAKGRERLVITDTDVNEADRDVSSKEMCSILNKYPDNKLARRLIDYLESYKDTDRWDNI